MHPPLIMLMRKAMRAVPIETDAGARCVIPKGDVVFAAPAIQGRLATCWTAPDGPTPTATRPAARSTRCPSRTLASAAASSVAWAADGCQVKTILSWLNRNYDAEIVQEFPSRPSTPPWSSGPRANTTVGYVRKAAAAASIGSGAPRGCKKCWRRAPAAWCRHGGAVEDARCSIGILKPAKSKRAYVKNMALDLAYVKQAGVFLRAPSLAPLKTLVFAGGPGGRERAKQGNAG